MTSSNIGFTIGKMSSLLEFFILCSLFSVAIGSAESLRIQLHVFSGTPDPVWTFPVTADDNSLIAMLRERGPSELASRLGYSGYTVTLLQGGQVRWTETVGRCKAPDLETRLLERVITHVPDNYDELLSDNVRDYVLNDITTCTPN